MTETPFVPVGRVIKVHGVNGEVSVAFAAGSVHAPPAGCEVWLVPPPEGPKSYRIESVRSGPKGPLVKFSGVDGRGEAEQLRGCTLLVSRDALPEGFLDLPDDLTGTRVYDEVRGFLGSITDVIITGANDVWVLDDGPYGQVLIPVITDVVLTLDVAAGEARVRLLPGLLPDAEERAL